MPSRNPRAAEERIRFLANLTTVLVQVNRAAKRATSPEQLFQEATRACAEFGGFDLAWVGVPDPGAGRLRLLAAHGPAAAYADGLDIALGADRPEGRGPSATCLREGRQVVVQDWDRDGTVAPWRDRARPFGMRSSAGLPVVQEGATVAVLTVYARQPNFFLPERLEVLAEMTDDLGFALGRLAQERQRLAAEAELQASEERFRLAFDRASVAKSLADAEGRLLHVNEAYGRLLGYTQEELETLTFHQLTHPEDRPATLEFIKWLMAGEGTSYRLEKRYLAKDGHLVWGDMNTVLLRDAANRPLRFVTDIVDITARKELEQELERRVAERTQQLASANEELEAFTYSVAHDLRAPLRTLAGFSELLARDPPAGLEAAHLGHLDRIHAAALRMAHLIDDLLRLSHLGEQELSTRPLDLAALARDVFARNQELEPAREVALRAESPLPVEGDPDLLQVLLENLIGNAWKFTARVPAAVIEVGREPSPGAYFVKDNGVGFPMTEAGRLFTPFTRLSSAADFPGTGIGLALAKRVVGRHGGRIWARSEPGRGTTVYFTVPGGARERP